MVGRMIDVKERQQWLRVLARAKPDEIDEALGHVLAESFADLADSAITLREPEVGTALVTGRVGATGAPFGSALWHYHQTLGRPRDFVLDSEGNLYFEWEKEIVPGAVAHALYVWDGAQVSEVIGPGTELFGKRVATIRLSRDGINARNEIAFLYQFNDGQSGVALLTSDLAPVPEVSTLASLMTGLLLLGLVARLRRFH